MLSHIGVASSLIADNIPIGSIPEFMISTNPEREIRISKTNCKGITYHLDNYYFQNEQ